MDLAADRRRLAPWFTVCVLAALASGCSMTNSGLVKGDSRNQVIISVRDQKLTVVEPDHTRVTFPISTSKFGFGDRRNSYATPLGELEVAQKIGDGAPPGSVFRSRVRTGEIVGIDAPGRDAIVTRILALRGLEQGNRDAWARGIYIHGTPEERNIGRPSSYGCIRMRSRDVIQLYNMVKVGARVQIIDTTMGKALASNIVTPPAAPPPVQPVSIPPNAVEVASSAPAPKVADQATAKAMSVAAAADRKAGTNGTPSIGTVSAPAATPKPAHAATVAGAPAPVKATAKNEWAGSPTKLLAKAAEVDAKAKNNKPLGAARASSNATNNPTGQSATNYSNSRDFSKSALDSL